MRLREPIIPDWLGYVIAVPIVVAAAPIIASFFVVFSLVWIKRRIFGPSEEWMRWFAWRPVSTGWDGTRWLEFVERRSFGVMLDTHYRAILNPESVGE